MCVAMETIISITSEDVIKEGPETLVSPNNPIPVKTLFLSNIDQALCFPVETVFFFEVSFSLDISERVKRSVSELLIPYYFMAGRLKFNTETDRLELVCNNAGVLFVSATSGLALKDLGDLSLPNPSFHHLIHPTGPSKSLADKPLLTLQVTRFKSGGFSIGFVTNHSVLDGRAASEMFQNLASICRGQGLKTHVLYVDRTCIKARNPIQIKYPHQEYTKQIEISSLRSSFTSPCQPLPSFHFSGKYIHELVVFSPRMVKVLKDKAPTNCSSFNVMVAHLWRARTRAVFSDPDEISTVMFAVDIRSKISPPLPNGFTGNAVITAYASARVCDLEEKPLSFAVELVMGATDRVTDEYVRSAIDWLEVHKGVPATLNGNFYVSAWWKLPFYELDFGCGKPIHYGPIVNGTDEFVLLLAEGSSRGNEGGGISVWIGLEQEKMQKFMLHVYEI